MVIMDRKKAKQLILLYKTIDLVLTVIIAILSTMIIPIACNMFFKYPDTKIPPVIFMWILYILFGIIGGVFCGLGMGGGTLLIPLISLIGISQKASQTINLISFILTSTVALIFHFKNNLVNCKNIFSFALLFAFNIFNFGQFFIQRYC